MWLSTAHVAELVYLDSHRFEVFETVLTGCDVEMMQSSSAYMTVGWSYVSRPGHDNQNSEH